MGDRTRQRIKFLRIHSSPHLEQRNIHPARTKHLYHHHENRKDQRHKTKHELSLHPPLRTRPRPQLLHQTSCALRHKQTKSLKRFHALLDSLEEELDRVAPLLFEVGVEEVSGWKKWELREWQWETIVGLKEGVRVRLADILGKVYEVVNMGRPSEDLG
ncbi:hypothetical protein LTR86_008092 [Recurvomyces mirabilis]|nr:hypothetical protein LTR86_008092 [Recurvomyces mirabilis]